jgi:hypothetical protein
MRKTLLLLILLGLAGCQTWGPTWSEISGARYNRAIEYRLPAVISRIDDQGAFASNPIKVEPGMHTIRLQGSLPGWQGTNFETLELDVLPCKRYYINEQYQNLIQPRYTPVVDHVEDIAGCKVAIALN